MAEESKINEQTAASDASEPETGDIMQGIQDMIGNLLKNAVEKMQQSETSMQLGETTSGDSEKNKLTAQMDIDEIKVFIDVMQKFITTVKSMVTQLETGIAGPGDAEEDKFLEGYIATADNILEMAAFNTKDTLTGLSNRYGFDNRLVLEWNRATRDKSTLGLVIFAVDGIENCGVKEKCEKMHKAIAQTLENTIKRSTDFIARWSEYEFAALLPITTINGASIVANRICSEFAKLEIPDLPEKTADTTVSIGICIDAPHPSEQPSDFINKAYEAFLKAKESGGNSINIV